MKLFIIIPAFNEEQTLGAVLQSIPKKINGIDSIQTLVYDDGSNDKTPSVAKKNNVDYLFYHAYNQGLARTFKDAVKEALRLGADIIVNTDADNQYNQKEIEKLVEPILKEKIDMVIGDRQVQSLKHMPKNKKYGNILGSFVIRALTGVKIVDASSGFRAFTKELAQSVNIFSDHTYTHEMIIDSYYKGFKIIDVPVEFKKRTAGKSRLISGGVIKHILKSGTTIIRTILLYRALKVFSILGGTFIIGGTFGLLRYLYFALIIGNSRGHIQSLIISAILFIFGWNILVLGFIADMIAYNRKLIEEIKS